jgi:diaminopimelate epimerase
MKITFEKYHGTGNDFIMIDDRDAKIVLSKEAISFICNRRFGIGADGMLLLQYSKDYDFRMRYYNADGGEGTMCGNGGRCITAFAKSLGIINENAHFTASDGAHFSKVKTIAADSYFVSLKMSDVNKAERFNDDFILDTGSPHLVKFVPDIKQVDVFTEGKKLRWDKAFQPGGINVNFVEIKKDHLVVRSFERGVEDITLSCGTGVTASVLAASLLDKGNSGHFDIKTDGGDLVVKFKKSDDHFTDIQLEGPAVKVFEGQIEI